MLLSFSSESHFVGVCCPWHSLSHPPSLHALPLSSQMMKAWVEDIARHRTTNVFGVLHFDLSNTRGELMPLVVDCFKVAMPYGTSHILLYSQPSSCY
jgi:hypothetical protein